MRLRTKLTMYGGEGRAPVHHFYYNLKICIIICLLSYSWLVIRVFFRFTFFCAKESEHDIAKFP